MLNKMSQNPNMKNYSLLNIGNTKNHPKSALVGSSGENDMGNE